MSTTWAYSIQQSLAELRAAIKTVITRISGDAHVQWRDEPAEFAADGVIVKLHWRNWRSVGTPEARERFVDADVGSEVKTDIVDQKVFTLQVLVEQYDQYITAADLLEQLRPRFYRPYTLEALRAVNCAVQTIEPTIELPTKHDKRIVSAAAFDARLAWAFVDTQEDFDAEREGETDAATFIEKMTFSGPAPKYGTTTVDSTQPL